jgi:hypothetical protein
MEQVINTTTEHSDYSCKYVFSSKGLLDGNSNLRVTEEHGTIESAYFSDVTTCYDFNNMTVSMMTSTRQTFNINEYRIELTRNGMLLKNIENNKDKIKISKKDQEYRFYLNYLRGKESELLAG